MNSILQKIQKNIPGCTYHVNVSLGYLRHAIKQYNLNLTPEYQRDYIWTKNQKEKFIGAFLENPKSIPPIWINWTKKEEQRDSSELIDGQQRIKSCLEWLDNIIIAKCPCGTKIAYKNLSEIDNRIISNSISFDWNFVELSKKEVMEFYIRLNCGGTVHTENEIDKIKNMINNL